MSERTFFDLRYALPGYTFILIAIFVAYPEMHNWLANIQDPTLVAAFLAFFSLLGGGALGFLVSQIWYWFHNSNRSGRYGKFQETREFLRAKYGLIEDVKREIIFNDYVHRLGDKQTLIYQERRYDLMHICGSTLFATLIGAFSGLLVRLGAFSLEAHFIEDIVAFFRLLVHFGASSLKVYLPDVVACPRTIFTRLLEEMRTYDLWVILTVVLLISLLLKGYLHVCEEHAMTNDFSVRKAVNSGCLPYWEARKIFTEDYFEESRSEVK